MNVTAVITHFFRGRRQNLEVIVRSLQEAAMRPDEVVIWNNEPEPIHVPRVTMIQSTRNIGAQARLLAALTAQTSHVLFLDNDVAVYPETLTGLVREAQLHPGAVVTLEGRARPADPKGTPYGQWPKIYGHGIKEPVRVFLSLGRGELVAKRIVAQVVSDFPFGSHKVMDDLWFSACCARLGVPVYVVPCAAGVSDLRDLPMGGGGMCKEPDYHARRNETIAQIEGGVS